MFKEFKDAESLGEAMPVTTDIVMTEEAFRRLKESDETITGEESEGLDSLLSLPIHVMKNELEVVSKALELQRLGKVVLLLIEDEQ